MRSHALLWLRRKVLFALNLLRKKWKLNIQYKKQTREDVLFKWTEYLKSNTMVLPLEKGV